jgi:GH24 family phage-related lysozyme (muramidase)
MDEFTLQLIRDKESFRATPYWDENAWRIGYGSDTITRADGTVIPMSRNRKVKPDVTVTKADAERDLQRRVPEFQRDGVIRYVGEAAWNKLPAEAKAAVTSLAYNYGSIANLRSIKRAIVAGDTKKLAAAIKARGVDNGGLNAGRRADEAKLVLSAKPAPARGNIAEQRAEQRLMRNRVIPPIPAARPFTVAGRPLIPLKAPEPLVAAPASGGLTSRSVKTKDYVVDPATGKVSLAASAANPPAPTVSPSAAAKAERLAKSAAAKAAIAPTGKTSAQIAQEADNARLNGYRAIQEAGPSSKGAKPTAAPAAPKPGVIKTTAPEQQPIPKGVVPQVIVGGSLTPKPTSANANLNSARAEQRSALTNKAPVAGLTPAGTKPTAASVLPGLNGGGAAAAARFERMNRANTAKATAARAAQRAQASAAAAAASAAAAMKARAQQAWQARAQSERAAATRAAILASMSPAGLAASAPGISHNYSTVAHAGERTDVFGNDQAFNTRSQQTSDRWNTGY